MAPRTWMEAADLFRSAFGNDGDPRQRMRELMASIERDRRRGPELPTGRGPGEAGLRGTTVPSAIRRGNPNIDRALTFDLAQTNPHAAGLLRELDAGQGRGSIRGEGVASGKAAGLAPQADALVSAFRKREGSAQTTERETAWGRYPEATLPASNEPASRSSGVEDIMASVFGKTGRPDVDSIVGNVRRSLGEMGAASEGKSLAETLMADILGQTAGRLGGTGTGASADAIVARIRDQAAQTAMGQRTGTGGFGTAPAATPTGALPQYPGSTQAGTLPQYPGASQPQPPSPFPPQGQGVGRTTAAGTDTLSTIPAPGTTTAPGGGYGNRPAIEAAIAQQPFDPTTARATVAAPGPTSGGGTLGSYGNQTIDQWDSAFVAAGQKYGVDPTLLKAMMEIESGGNGNLALTQCRSDGTGQDSCGPMQVKPGIWGAVDSVPAQIEQAAKILADGVSSGKYATHKDALFGIYFPGNDPNGTTQGSYGARVSELQEQMGAYTPGAAPAGQPGAAAPGQGPTTGADLFPGSNRLLPTPGTGMNAPLSGNSIPFDPAAQDVFPRNAAGVPTTPNGESPAAPVQPGKIPQATGTMAVGTSADGMGLTASPETDDSWMQQAYGPNAAVSTAYKQPVTWSCTDCGAGCLYDYQCGQRGVYAPGSADASTHAGMDILCAPGNASETCRGAPVTSHTGGTVLCSGGQGEGNYVGCNFATSPEVVDNGGVGQIALDVGDDVNGNMIVMEYWHMETSNVTPGQTIQPGTQIGGMGSMGGMVHTHMEAQGWCDALGGMVPLDPTLVSNGYYSTHDPCEGYV